MKLRAADIKQNPFKKEINGGDLNEEKVQVLMGTVKDLGLMGSLPVVLHNGKYCLVSGHHRLEAFKRVHGKDAQIEVTLHKYDDETMLRGMVVENLTQRQGEFLEEKENLVLVKKFLQGNSVHSVNRIKTEKNPKGAGAPSEAGSVRDIAAWLNRNSEVMSLGKICSILQIAENLAPELLEKVGKANTTSIGNQNEELIPVKTAEILAKIESHEEQMALAPILLNTDEFSSNLEREKAVSVYKQLDEEDKQKVLNGEVELSSYRKGDDALGEGEFALKFNMKANNLVLEMRALRKTLAQFRSENLFEQFTPRQRTSFAQRLSNVEKEYGELVSELRKSFEVLKNEEN